VRDSSGALFLIVLQKTIKKKRERIARPVVFTEGHAQIIKRNVTRNLIKKCRPISRILFTLNLTSTLPYHLSRLAITHKLHLSTLQQRASNPFHDSYRELIYLKFHRIEFTWFHYSITCTYFLLHLS
jgi:hypothetical protein